MSNHSIQGTYHLERREFPDGSVQEYPEVRGMMTYTRGYRNFSVLWQDENGNIYSECYAARYLLTDSEYTETSEYLFINDEIGGNGVSYDLANTRASSSVEASGDEISFDLPQQFEAQLNIRVTFREDEMIADLKGLFVDIWKKVP